MGSRDIVRQFGPSEDEVDRLLEQCLAGDTPAGTAALYEDSVRNFSLDTVLKGRVIEVIGNDVIVDVGYKSEGVVPAAEFGETAPKVGDTVEVYLESVQDESGLIVLSKRKADKIRGWERVISTHKEGDVVKGAAVRKIKGGLLVDIGIPVFLPASQISIRRTGDISQFLGQEIEGRIIKIDESRMNIVISRRKLLEEGRDRQKQDLLGTLEEGQIRRGVVKNIADFGAFVDLGGIDGLLHITDMAWGRMNHPSEMLGIDDEIEVKVLRFDRQSERIALGLKQKTESPWRNIEERYRPGMRVQGEVVNVMNYGAFVKLEEGVEGLVHISEMSWTRRVNHPSEIVNVGDIVDVVVLSVNPAKQEISLGMKQVEINPWTQVEEKYPIGTIIRGRVRNLTNYGAFIEIEEGIDGLLHVSDMSWTKKISHPSELLKKGDEIEAVVLSVDQEKKRVALGAKQLHEDPWTTAIPDRYQIGAEMQGRVTKITNFGVFVELESDLEGLLHISELSDRKVANPEEIVNAGDLVSVKVIKVNSEERKIGLTLLSVIEKAKPEKKARKARSDAEKGEAAAAGAEEASEPAETEPGSAGSEPPLADAPVGT